MPWDVPTHDPDTAVGVDNGWSILFSDAAAKTDYAPIRAAVRTLGLQAGFAEEASMDLAMACHEAVINAVLHGSPSRLEDWVGVESRVREGYLEIHVTSRDTAWELPPPERPRSVAEPGLGFFLIRTFVDEVELFKEPGRCRLVLRRKIPR